MDSTQILTDRTGKMFPWNVFQSQFQALGFSLKAALGHSPLPAQSQCCGKKLFRCHLSNKCIIAERQIPWSLPERGLPKAFAVDSPPRGTSGVLLNAKCSHPLSAKRSLLKRETE